MYPYNTRFCVFTDSRAAKSLLKANDAKAGGRFLRWRQLDFDILHRSGVKNGNADALSHFHLIRNDPYDEGPTDIVPSTALNVVDAEIASPLNEITTDRPTNLRLLTILLESIMQSYTIATRSTPMTPESHP
jgi:hypothetical protein